MRLLWLFEFGPVLWLHWAAFQRPVVFVFLAPSPWMESKWVLEYMGIWAGEGRKKNAIVFFFAFLQAFLGTGQRGGGGYITWGRDRDRKDMRLERRTR